MESNITNQQSWSLDSPLTQPHFDQEATLLSARPVVPINQLIVKPGFSRPWVFGLAVAGALLVGVSATALYFSQFRTTQSQPVTNIEPVSSGARGVASEAVALDEPATPQATGATQATELSQPIAATGARAGTSSVHPAPAARERAQAPSDPWTTRPLNSSTSVSKKPVHRSAPVVVNQNSEWEYETQEQRGAKRTNGDENSESEYETQERRGAKREAREQKRANRERRGRRLSDELLRIGDIIERSRRP